MIELLKIEPSEKITLPSGIESRFLNFDLKHLLPLVAEEGPSLHWAAIPIGAESTYLTGTQDPSSDQIFALGEKIDATETGLPFTWQELTDLSQKIGQTIWGTFVAVQNPAALDELPTLFNGEWRYLHRGTTRFYDLVEIAFQAVDSSFWLAWAKDPQILDRIQTNFTEVNKIPGNQPRPDRSAGASPAAPPKRPLPGVS